MRRACGLFPLNGATEWNRIQVVRVQSRMFMRRVYAAVVIGILLRFVVGLHPVSWLVWFAPLPLLLLAFRSTARETAMLTFLAALIGQSANFHYYHLVMPLVAVCFVMIAQSLVWMLVVGATRRVVLRYQAWWTVFAYPVFWVAMDTLAAHLLPDTNWGSLAYSQADSLPVLQLSALAGVGGVLFLIALIPSALALGFGYGSKIPQLWRSYAVVALLLAGALGYGEIRLQRPQTGHPVTFGLIAIDDAIGPHASQNYVDNIWSNYDQQARSLAAQGAEVIVLPEKIGTIPAEQAQLWQGHLSALAAELQVWIVAGVGVIDGTKRLNLAWLFTPQGELSANYQKHHMAPPERDFIGGNSYEVRAINGVTYGLAICKDMHFASLGRAYGERRVAAMLVPAWDFYFDGWLASRMTAMRGVENGYAVIRASRDGLLTVSDGYGRVAGERQSSGLPGSAMLVRTSVSAPISTVYTKTGDLLGWLCVGAGAFLAVVGRGRAEPRRIAAQDNR